MCCLPSTLSGIRARCGSFLDWFATMKTRGKMLSMRNGDNRSDCHWAERGSSQFHRCALHSAAKILSIGSTKSAPPSQCIRNASPDGRVSWRACRAALDSSEKRSWLLVPDNMNHEVETTGTKWYWPWPKASRFASHGVRSQLPIVGAKLEKAAIH